MSYKYFEIDKEGMEKLANCDDMTFERELKKANFDSDTETFIRLAREHAEENKKYDYLVRFE